MSYKQSENRVQALESLARTANLLLSISRGIGDTGTIILETVEAEVKIIQKYQNEIEPISKE